MEIYGQYSGDYWQEVKTNITFDCLYEIISLRCWMNSVAWYGARILQLHWKGVWKLRILTRGSMQIRDGLHRKYSSHSSHFSHIHPQTFMLSETSFAANLRINVVILQIAVRFKSFSNVVGNAVGPPP